MNELNYTLYIDESGVSSNKLTFKSSLQDRSFYALGSLQAQKKDIDDYYNKYLKKFEINEEIKYKDLKNQKDKLHEILRIIYDSEFKINIEFVESQLYYLTLFCDYVYFPWWLFDDDVVEYSQSFFRNHSNEFDERFFNLLNDLFISTNFESYEVAYNNLIPYLTEKQIMSENDLNINLQKTKDLLNKGSYIFQEIKPLTNQYNNHTEIIVLPHLQCLYNLLKKANDVKTIIHDVNLHYQNLLFDDIKKHEKKDIIFKDSKSESGLKVIDLVVSYCKNTIEHMIKNNNFQEINYVSYFIQNINFVINKNSLDYLSSEIYKSPIASLCYLMHHK